MYSIPIVIPVWRQTSLNLHTESVRICISNCLIMLMNDGCITLDESGTVNPDSADDKPMSADMKTEVSVDHKTRHSGATAKPRVSCDECEKSFTSASTLYHHKRAIHGPGGKPYACPQCDARFNFNHSLKLHVLKHAGQRPHQCSTCGKSYLTASHLKYHIDAIHSATKRFVCNVCHKSFPYKTSFKLHRRLHTGM